MRRRTVVHLLGVGILVIVVGCSSTDSDSPTSVAESVAVSGTEHSCAKVSDDGLLSEYECTYTMSDERVTGTAHITARLDEFPPPTGMDGTFVLANDRGSWSGDWAGEITADDIHIIDGLYLGAGDFEGLQYRQHIEGVSHPMTTTGTIEPAP